MTYAEKLKDPRWQKKRLEVFQRDNFTCASSGCYADDKTLHVHHLVYLANKEPWDYPLDHLMTLCEDCHKYIEERQESQVHQITQQFKLKLKSPFERDCAIMVFTEYEELSNLIYVLYELKTCKKEDLVLELLRVEFRKAIDECLEGLKSVHPSQPPAAVEE